MNRNIERNGSLTSHDTKDVGVLRSRNKMTKMDKLKNILPRIIEILEISLYFSALFLLIPFMLFQAGKQEALEKNIENNNIIYLNVSSNANEKQWINALAKELNGKTEQPIKMGRIDVLTSEDSIEVDWTHKWHESIGQALHYSIETDKKATIAIITENPKEQAKLNYIQSICDKLKIKMIVLKRK